MIVKDVNELYMTEIKTVAKMVIKKGQESQLKGKYKSLRRAD